VATRIEETNLAENLTVAKAMEVLKDAALDMKAEDIAILDMTGVVDYLDIMCLATGETGLQVRAIADRIMERLREYGIIPDSLQGHREGSWVVLDYGWLVVHVMLPDLRAFYRLEDLWSEARALHI
jgi:ribosome-associated protein